MILFSGFIPKSQHYFGKRYAENALNSIADFEGDQQNRSYKTEEMRRLEAQQSGRLEAKEGEVRNNGIRNRWHLKSVHI